MMTILAHELQTSWKKLLIWTTSLAGFVIILILIYPEMIDKANINDIYSQLGAFSQAFGLDRIRIDDLLGFYSLECGTTLAIGGGLFASLTGVSILAKEESRRTADFMFSHPISRPSVVIQKLLAVIIQIIVLNLIIIGVALITIQIINESVDLSTFLIYHLGLLLAMLQIGIISFGFGALSQHENFGLATGLVVVFYFVNIIINLKSNFSWLKYFTPFYYAEASRVLVDSNIDWQVFGWQILASLTFLALSLFLYNKKDLRG